MRTAICVFLTTAVALAAGVASATAAEGNSANAKQCQKSGWQTLARANGSGFDNQDECVSYTAEGGTFGTPRPDLQLVISGCALSGSSIDCAFHVKNVGPGTVTGVVAVQAQLTYTTTSIDLQHPFDSAIGCNYAAATTDLWPPDISAAGFASCPATGAGVGVFDSLSIEVGANAIPAAVTVTVTAQADPDNIIAESNETNNSFSQTLVVPAG